MEIDRFYSAVRIAWFVSLVIVGLLAVYGEDIIQYQERNKGVQKKSTNNSR